jgi:hypothetical protein
MHLSSAPFIRAFMHVTHTYRYYYALYYTSAHDAFFSGILALWTVTLVVNTHRLYNWVSRPFGAYIDQSLRWLLTLLQPLAEGVVSRLSAVGL